MRIGATLAVLGIAAWLAGASALAASGPADKAAQIFEGRGAMARSEAAVGRMVGDVALVDSAGRPIRLADFRGRPLVVSFVFTSCADLCPVITATLADVAEAGWDALGADSFAVLTVGFDAANDTPQRMRSFARAHGVASPNWTFAAGELPSVLGLADALGFTFVPSPRGFDHLNQTTLLDGQGRVVRQIYGDRFGPQALVEPLKRLALGEAEPLTSLAELGRTVRLYCTVYDAASGRYRVDYSYLIELIVGGTVIVGLLVMLVRLLRRPAAPRRPT